MTVADVLHVADQAHEAVLGVAAWSVVVAVCVLFMAAVGYAACVAAGNADRLLEMARERAAHRPYDYERQGI